MVSHCEVCANDFESKRRRRFCDRCLPSARSRASHDAGAKILTPDELPGLTSLFDFEGQFLRPNSQGYDLMMVNKACPSCETVTTDTVSHVRYRLRTGVYSGLCQSCSGKKNSKIARAANWKGGRLVRKDGYVRVWVDDPDHPGAAFRNERGGYVLEHRLVMEQELGRFLLPDENVHHRNGVKDDNRPENLELWVTSQPSGQRVSEVVAWAKEILDRYDSLTAA